MARDPSFLGTGWSFPPAFAAGGGEVQVVSDEQDIEQSLAILLATRRGERVMREDFGCALADFVFGEVNESLIGRVRSLVADAILLNEPRVRLNGLDVADAGEGMLRISIDYTIRATNSRYNMVYPFYLEEGAPPGA